MQRFSTAGAVLALLAIGLVAGPVAPAGASPSARCADGFPTETPVIAHGTGPYVAVEWYNSSWTGGSSSVSDDNWATVCYSDSPAGSASSAVGGAIQFRVVRTAPTEYLIYVVCWGDQPTSVATVNCNTAALTVTTTSVATSPISAGATVAGAFYLNDSTVVFGATGGNTGAVTTTSGSNPEITYGGTCATISGNTAIPCSGTTAAAQAAVGDANPVIVGGSTGSCLIQIGSCLAYLPKTGIAVFTDPASTEASVLGVPLGIDPGYTCVGIC